MLQRSGKGYGSGDPCRFEVGQSYQASRTPACRILADQCLSRVGELEEDQVYGTRPVLRKE